MISSSPTGAHNEYGMKQTRSQVKRLLSSTLSESVEKVKSRRSSQKHKRLLSPGHPRFGPQGKFDPRFDFVVEIGKNSSNFLLTKRSFYDILFTMVK